MWLAHKASARSSDKASATVSSITITHATTSITNNWNGNFIYTWRHIQIFEHETCNNNVRAITIIKWYDVCLAYLSTEIFLPDEERSVQCDPVVGLLSHWLGLLIYGNFWIPSRLVPLPLLIAQHRIIFWKQRRFCKCASE